MDSVTRCTKIIIASTKPAAIVKVDWSKPIKRPEFLSSIRKIQFRSANIATANHMKLTSATPKRITKPDLTLLALPCMASRVAMENELAVCRACGQLPRGNSVVN